MNLIDTVKNYLILILCVALAAGGFYHWGRTKAFEATISDLSAKIVALQSAFDKVVEANKELDASIGIQNKSIEAMAADAAARKNAANAALAKARAEAGKWKKKYDDILSQPPANPDDQAGSLNLRLDQYIATRHSEVTK